LVFTKWRNTMIIPIKIHADTSVLDSDFSEPSRHCLNKTDSSRFILVTSAVIEELLGD
jgi:hypothetical protein